MMSAQLRVYRRTEWRRLSPVVTVAFRMIRSMRAFSATSSSVFRQRKRATIVTIHPRTTAPMIRKAIIRGSAFTLRMYSRLSGGISATKETPRGTTTATAIMNVAITVTRNKTVFLVSIAISYTIAVPSMGRSRDAPVFRKESIVI
jgi:hypothetical protein